MAIQEIQEKHTETFPKFFRAFLLEDGTELLFEVDQEGYLHGHDWETDRKLVSLDTARRYQACLSGIDEQGRTVRDCGLKRAEMRVTYPKMGHCTCGEWVELSNNFTNTCDCGADYDSSGNLLTPRWQWGEETGEHWSDCYNPGSGWDE